MHRPCRQQDKAKQHNLNDDDMAEQSPTVLDIDAEGKRQRRERDGGHC